MSYLEMKHISFTLIWNLHFPHLNCLCSDQCGFCPRNSSWLCSFVFKGSLASFERLQCPELFILTCRHYLMFYTPPLWGWQKPQLSGLYTASLMAILVFLFSSLSDVRFLSSVSSHTDVGSTHVVNLPGLWPIHFNFVFHGDTWSSGLVLYDY